MPAQSSSDPTLRPSAPDPELVAWLWSAEGDLWHQKYIRCVHHAGGAFAEVKDDHECDPDRCFPSPYSPYSDGYILADLREYGISGVPEEWKRR